MTMKKRPNWEDAWQFVRGLLMGGADVIPGVSGGTVALILGIYQRLIEAVSRVDTTLLGHLKRGELSAAAKHLDLRFLVPLGLGIVTGVVTLGGVMHRLLTGPDTRGFTLAAFFGMIAASAFLVLRIANLPRPQRRIGYSVVLMAAVVAFVVTGLPPSQAELTPVYTFLSGMIGICAMILPGISGAYLLLVLGAYTPLTEILHRLPHGQITSADALTVVIFGAGCLSGLLTFSKVLRWLLRRHESWTLVVLCGLMVGALRKVWPFQRLTGDAPHGAKDAVYELVWPGQWDGQVLGCFAIAVCAGLLVMLVDWQVRTKHAARPTEHRGASSN